MQIKKQALLTGAGFSCNVGGLSGQQIRTILFNNPKVKENNQIAQIVNASGADYESIYRTIIEGDTFKAEEKRTIIDAYDNAYSKLDQSICTAFTTPQQHTLNLNRLSTFLEWFAGADGGGERGHIFTLNQDLFIERGFFGNVNLGVPGIPQWRINPRWVPLADWDANGHGPRPIHVVPDENDCKGFMENDMKGHEVSQGLQYIKLHGSMNWRTKGESRAMVIAGRKLEQINSIPLLNWYLEKFRDGLTTPGLHLCVIGYGFGDPHINRPLAEAIDKRKLVLSIVYPGNWDELLKNMRERGKQLEKEGEADLSETLICGLTRGKHFDFDLKKAFPPPGDAGETYEARQLREIFGPS
jgi:hypothetical protein